MCSSLNIFNVDDGQVFYDRLVYELNRILLSALLEYRIYLNQLNRIKPMYSLTGTVQVFLLVWGPVLCRLMKVYWPEENHKHQLMIAYALILCSTTLIPLCRLDSLAVQSTRQLWQALAQSININQRLSDQMGSNQQVYFQHTIQLYHKEIFDSRERIKSLAVKTIFCNLTYRNVCKIHYWYFIFILATFYETESWRRLLGRRINDPLGVFIT